MKAGKIVEGVAGFLARIGRMVAGIVTKKRLERCKRLLSVWTRRYPVEFFAGVAAVVLVFWLFSPFYMRLFFGEDAGTKGDSFGALTSLFTGAAFVGLIATLMQQQREIRMQRQDLKLQRDEMQEMRGELAGQKEEMALQNQSLKQQMFEQTFFNLLNVFNQYIRDLNEESHAALKSSSVESPKPAKGRKYLQKIAKRLIQKLVGDNTSKSIAVKLEDLWGKEGDVLNSYFRVLFNVLKWVDRNDIENKKVYTNIVRAQLSDSELQLIALNCARKKGTEMQKFVKRYDLLKHLPPTLNEMDIHEICDEIRRLEAQEAEVA